MTLIVVTGVALVGMAVVLFVRAARVSRVHTVETLGNISDYGFARGRRGVSANEEHVPGPLDRFASVVGHLVESMPIIREVDVRKELIAAGLYRIDPRRLMGYQVMAGVGMPLLWIYASATTGVAAGLALLGAIFSLAAGWYAPLMIVRRRARSRLESIEKDLPELIDLLVVTVEAGLGFNASLKVASERLVGPLGDELRLTLQEQSMGLETNEALRNLLNRVETPSVRSFVRSIIQGEQLGVSIGQIMRTLADEMRKRRKAAAEEKAQKAPIKILFPLVFLIFPAMFVVLLGPAAFAFIDALRG